MIMLSACETVVPVTAKVPLEVSTTGNPLKAEESTSETGPEFVKVGCVPLWSTQLDTSPPLDAMPRSARSQRTHPGNVSGEKNGVFARATRTRNVTLHVPYEDEITC